MMDDETLQMFLEESREHLENIENDLLRIEEAGADVDVDLVNKVFRAAHSMKGGAGFLGLTNIKELAHKIENVLDMIRNGEVTPNPEIVNIILLAFDRLREMVENVQDSQDMDISDHVVALTGITSSTLPEEEKDTLVQEVSIHNRSGKEVFRISEHDFKQSLKGGKFLYLLEFDLIHDVHRKNKTPLDVIKDMQSTGSILELTMDLETVGTLDDDAFSNQIPLFILFSTIIEPDIINTLFDMPQERIVQIPGPEEGTQESESRPEPEAAEETPQEEPPEPEEEQVQETPQEDLESQAQSQPEPESAPPPSQEPEEAPKTDKQKAEPDKAQSKPAADKSAQASSMPESLRVNVSLLENLMNLAGELVLSRNQLMQAISTGDDQTMQVAGQRIDTVTSELQEAIMLTRMQPVSNVFNKFPRVVRDMSQELGKDIQLVMEGKEVELDKTIIEGLSDPLTHLVRNSADHAIEKPDERLSKGKPAQGTITLKAFHAAGQVNIEIIDDGRGIPVDKIAEKALSRELISEEQLRTMTDKDKAQLIFLPGLSTADQITDVSGRGVGMDVVKSNLDRLGGQVDIDTEKDKGTSIRIKLPLTLAIIPSLLISVRQEKFAIPQINVDELIQIPAQQVPEKIEMVGDAQVLILRGELIPLVGLAELMDLDRIHAGKKSRVLLDAPSQDSEAGQASSQGDSGEQKSMVQESKQTISGQEHVDIVVVHSGAFKYGLVVDELHDSVEIVVKPLGRHLKGCEGYAGATIMGDGNVALILDVVGLARLAELSSMAGTEKAKEVAREEGEKKTDMHSLFLFNNGPKEHCAVPLDLVARVEQIRAEDIEVTGGKKVVQYRGGVLPVFALHEAANVEHLQLEGDLIVIVFYMAGHEIGLLASPPVDAVEIEVSIDDFTLRQTGISGSAIINGYTTLIVDIYELMETLNPHWFANREVATSAEMGGSKILLVEDSDFFRNQVKKFIQDEGYQVIAAEDGEVAWQYLQDHPHEVQLVVTDLEMPNMDGFELTEQIKGDARFAHLPVLALTSLAGEEDVAKGKQVGIDDYQIKLDKEKLLQSIFNFLSKKAA